MTDEELNHTIEQQDIIDELRRCAAVMTYAAEEIVYLRGQLQITIAHNARLMSEVMLTRRKELFA